VPYAEYAFLKARVPVGRGSQLGGAGGYGQSDYGVPYDRIQDGFDGHQG